MIAWRGFIAPTIANKPLDPTLMFKALFIGYLFGVRSERQLVREIEVNVAYRWFLRLGLTDAVFDASTLSQNRRRKFNDTSVAQDIFDAIVQQALHRGFVEGRVLYTNSTHLKANANKNKYDLEVVAKSRADYWSALDAAIDANHAAHGKPPRVSCQCLLAAAAQNIQENALILADKGRSSQQPDVPARDQTSKTKHRSPSKQNPAKILTGFVSGLSRAPGPGFSLRDPAQAQSLPSLSSFARARSSGLMATRNSTSASNVRYQGSANDGTSEASFKSTTSTPPRWPLISVKYATSGLIFSRIFWIFFPAVPSRKKVLKGSGGKVTFMSMRMGETFLVDAAGWSQRPSRH